MTLGPEYPEVLAYFFESMRAALVERGHSDEDATETALQVVERVRADFGGQFIYIPLGSRFETMKRWAEIWGQWTGTESTPRLAHKYRCSEVHINRIVRHMREVEARTRQGELVDPTTVSPPGKPRT